MKQSAKRFMSLIVSFALVVAALVIYFNLIQPAYEDGQRIKAEEIAERNFNSAQQDAVSAVKKLQSDYQGKAGQQLQELVSLALPLSAPDVAGGIAQISGLAQNNNLALQRVSVGAPALQTIGGSDAPGAKGAAPTLVKPLGTITFEVRTIGTYENFKAFIKNIETNVRVFDVKQMSFQPIAKPNQDTYLFDLTLAAYYQGT